MPKEQRVDSEELLLRGNAVACANRRGHDNRATRRVLTRIVRIYGLSGTTQAGSVGWPRVSL
jgi:hypothetical protein